MNALVAAPGKPGAIELRAVEEPAPRPGEALVEVRAVSLNRGEVRALGTAEDGWQPGWDVAGTVLEPAGDGSGPDVGTRVVGLVGAGAWAQRAAVRTTLLAPIPDALSFPAAATLPVAGLTAYRALAVAGMVDGQRVLVTGAAGGVGRFAVQLAGHGGARVTAIVGSKERATGLLELGAHDVVVGIPTEGEFDVILESAGGSSLGTALTLVAPNGTVVSYGNSSREPTTFDVGAFYSRSGARLYAFVLLPELQRSGTAVRDLAYLAGLTATGRLDPQIGLTAEWEDAAAAVDALMSRTVAGKAVLLIE
jgi:NADPH2:quinone reductase